MTSRCPWCGQPTRMEFVRSNSTRSAPGTGRVELGWIGSEDEFLRTLHLTEPTGAKSSTSPA